jgi:hypothetical protein
MDIEDVVLVATVREDVHNHVLQVDAAETPRRVEAAQAGELVPSAVPASGAVEHALIHTGQKQASNGYESDGEATVSSIPVDNELVWINGLTRVSRKRKRHKRILTCGQIVWDS